jgi:hypothetical protein
LQQTTGDVRLTRQQSGAIPRKNYNEDKDEEEKGSKKEEKKEKKSPSKRSASTSPIRKGRTSKKTKSSQVEGSRVEGDEEGDGDVMHVEAMVDEPVGVGGEQLQVDWSKDPYNLPAWMLKRRDIGNAKDILFDEVDADALLSYYLLKQEDKDEYWRTKAVLPLPSSKSLTGAPSVKNSNVDYSVLPFDRQIDLAVAFALNTTNATHELLVDFFLWRNPHEFLIKPLFM